jgi:hypothetical protein
VSLAPVFLGSLARRRLATLFSLRSPSSSASPSAWPSRRCMKRRWRIRPRPAFAGRRCRLAGGRPARRLRRKPLLPFSPAAPKLPKPARIVELEVRPAGSGRSAASARRGCLRAGPGDAGPAAEAGRRGRALAALADDTHLPQPCAHSLPWRSAPATTSTFRPGRAADTDDRRRHSRRGRQRRLAVMDIAAVQIAFRARPDVSPASTSSWPRAWRPRRHVRRCRPSCPPAC